MQHSSKFKKKSYDDNIIIIINKLIKHWLIRPRGMIMGVSRCLLLPSEFHRCPKTL